MSGFFVPTDFKFHTDLLRIEPRSVVFKFQYNHEILTMAGFTEIAIAS